MYSGATTLLTVLSVVMHAVLGCCAHHDHVCTVGQASSAQMPATDVSSEKLSEAPVRACCHRHAVASADAATPEDRNSTRSSQQQQEHGHRHCGDDCTWGLATNTASEQMGNWNCPVADAHGVALVVANAKAVQQQVFQFQHSVPKRRVPLRARTQVWRL